MKAARTVAALAVAVFAALALCTAARSDGATGNRDRRFYSARAGVGLEAPPGWSLSAHTGYLNILCLLVHPSGGRISLAVDAAVTAQDAAALADQSRPGLAAQGIEITGVAPGPRGGVVVDARVARRHQALRQLYLVRAVEGTPSRRQAIVLTLTTTPADLAAAGGALDWVIARLDLEAPLRSDDKHDHPDGGL
ncbi:MAG TPA: hypothetical protein VLC06_13515 [Polyangia bacterium]|nr:hypothetical protein [Polyangia bacterium]